MKKTGKILSSLIALTLVFNNTVYATNEVASKSEGIQSKYIFMGVALLVIVLLLFLGYRMDTKENDVSTSRVPKKSKKKEPKKKVREEVVYNDDVNVTYESDNVSANDLNEDVEYMEDDDRLFTSDGSFDSDVNNNPYDFSLNNYEEDENEATGEVFDTSIIDEIDNEDNISTDSNINSLNMDSVNPNLNGINLMDTNMNSINSMDTNIDSLNPIDTNLNNVNSINSDFIDENNSKSFDETMIFNTENNNFSINKLEKEIDDLDNLDSDIKETNINEETDSFIEELKKFKEPESTFEGFSVATNENGEGNSKTKYTKKEDLEEQPIIEEMPEELPVDYNFLFQMEENLEKEKKVSKKSTTKKSATTKKSTTKKKKE
ncbi:MAG: hypothetical protein HFJ45_03605 [Clostridia bacterium]|nr:hypothetical protein [Clostridia bacterium]